LITIDPVSEEPSQRFQNREREEHATLAWQNGKASEPTPIDLGRPTPTDAAAIIEITTLEWPPTEIGFKTTYDTDFVKETVSVPITMYISTTIFVSTTDISTSFFITTYYLSQTECSVTVTSYPVTWEGKQPETVLITM
jgi:hypothetical protein